MERIKKLFNPYGIDTIPIYKGALEVERGESDAFGALKRVLLGCQWFHVFDVIEDALAQMDFHERELAEPDEEARSPQLKKELNDYFVHAGIGWKVEDGRIVIRQEESAEKALAGAIADVTSGGRPTAAKHLQAAIAALSQRPTADTAGAVAHATSAVECVLNDITGESLTLGKYLDQHPKLFHSALKKGLDGLYGFASDAGARHGKEGIEPSLPEAEFAVTICAATCSLLNRVRPR
jgi:hypothetical protein